MIHLEKRLSIIAKLSVSASIGAFFAILALGKIDLILVKNGMPLFSGGLAMLIFGMLRFTWVSLDSLPPLYKHLTKRQALDVKDVAEYIRIKCKSTIFFIIAYFFFIFILKMFIDKDTFFLINGALLGVQVLLAAQFADHYFSISSFKRRILEDVAEKEKINDRNKRLED
jgi:hypothetical protein